MAVSENLAQLRRKAKKFGVKIVAVRDDVGWGYWLEGTGWEDGNFCADHGEIEQAISDLYTARAQQMIDDVYRIAGTAD